MRMRINKGKASGKMSAPPSKSMAHRYLICSGLAEGKSVISGIDKSEDVLATIDCLRAIGAGVEFQGKDVVVNGAFSVTTSPDKPLFCRESGSTQRFFVPICLTSETPSIIEGKESLFKRPLGVYEKICLEQGITFEQSASSLYLDGKLKSGEYKVKGNISSQFISGLLFALPLLEGDSTISILPPIESRPYINLTVSALQKFGVSVQWLDDKTIFIKGSQRYKACSCAVEGDYSNSAFFAALNALGSDIEIGGLDIMATRITRRVLPERLRGSLVVQVAVLRHSQQIQTLLSLVATLLHRHQLLQQTGCMLVLATGEGLLGIFVLRLVVAILIDSVELRCATAHQKGGE